MKQVYEVMSSKVSSSQHNKKATNHWLSSAITNPLLPQSEPVLSFAQIRSFCSWTGEYKGWEPLGNDPWAFRKKKKNTQAIYVMVNSKLHKFIHSTCCINHHPQNYIIFLFIQNFKFLLTSIFVNAYMSIVKI